MPMKTQGTEIFMIDPADKSVVKIGGITGFNPGGAPADPIDTTTLDVHDKSSMKGLRTPGAAGGTVLADPRKPEHVRLHDLSQDDSDTECKWVLGWSDGTDAPTATPEGLWTLPTTRTWYAFDGYVADFPFDFQGNAAVNTQLSIQRTGKGQWTPKAGA